MTADTAREQGIVPALAVEEVVRDADYIIEFDADTAQVIGVFYADGRSGFGSTPASTNAAKTYYETEGASTDQAARMGRDLRSATMAAPPAPRPRSARESGDLGGRSNGLLDGARSQHRRGRARAPPRPR
ncbi:MAG: hypothetical protein ACLSGS_11275 [Adlercreutzia sp.]